MHVKTPHSVFSYWGEYHLQYVEHIAIASFKIQRFSNLICPYSQHLKIILFRIKMYTQSSLNRKFRQLSFQYRKQQVPSAQDFLRYGGELSRALRFQDSLLLPSSSVYGNFSSRFSRLQRTVWRKPQSRLCEARRRRRWSHCHRSCVHHQGNRIPSLS